MNLLFFRYFKYIFGLNILLLAFPIVCSAADKDADKSYELPLRAWIHDPYISNVSLSPDGKTLVALTLTDVNKSAELTFWDTADLAMPPHRYRLKTSKPISVTWLNNDIVFVAGIRKFDRRFRARNIKTFDIKTYLYNFKEKKFSQSLFKNDNFLQVGIENRLHNDPDHILVRTLNRDYAQEFYLTNFKKKTSKLIYRGGEGYFYFTDVLGNVAGKMDIGGSGKNIYISTSLKDPGTDKWKEAFRNYSSKREGLGNAQIVADGSVYVLDNTGRDLSVIRTLDPGTGKLSEPVFADEGYEMLGVMTSGQPSNYGQVIGYARARELVERVYTDPLHIKLQNIIDAALPGTNQNRMISHSDDMRMIVVQASSPKEAGHYYLLIDGQKMISLGRAYPHLDPNKLADMKFVTYKARDGLTIPAYLTLPPFGKKPYPSIVLPHGGPWARDYLGWDLWAQFLANRGYAVLQPQYRGSDGFGQKLWRAGDREWGQKMQDDKDDGAYWMIKEGITSKDRVAMFGYSYGGYAAMAAIVREDPPYQCAIAGAGLSELGTFDKLTFTSPILRQYQNPTIAGLSPYYEAKNAKIPIFIFHGDRDQRVPLNQSRKYVKALEKHKKDVKYLEVRDLWHSFPWWPQHHLAILSSVEDYLEKECGEGGL